MTRERLIVAAVVWGLILVGMLAGVIVERRL